MWSGRRNAITFIWDLLYAAPIPPNIRIVKVLTITRQCTQVFLANRACCVTSFVASFWTSISVYLCPFLSLSLYVSFCFWFALHMYTSGVNKLSILIRILWSEALTQRVHDIILAGVFFCICCVCVFFFSLLMIWLEVNLHDLSQS